MIDNKAGNLGATGNVITTTDAGADGRTRTEEEGARGVDRRPPKDFKYDDAARRMTYTSDAHMSGPEGDMTAARIELFLKPSGDELDRAEALRRTSCCASRAARPRAAS